MTFIESVKTCLLRKYCSCQGTASRSEFWWFTLFTAAVVFLTSFVPVLCVLAVLGLLFPQLGVSVRRLQDAGYSGKVMFSFVFIPVILLSFILFATMMLHWNSETFLTVSGVTLAICLLYPVFFFLRSSGSVHRSED